jgi:hypothetical protein
MRPLRWSKKTDQLVRYVAARCRPGLQSELGHWLEVSSRFAAFVTANQDKVRKKLSTSNDESRLDVRSELLIAYLILADHRFELAFEAYGARRRGPDLTVTYRANQRFNLEVTRLRATASASESVSRLANVILGKLRQMPAEVPNGLVVTTRGLALTEEDLAASVRLLKLHNDSNDDAFFARRGLESTRDFYAQYLHLSATFALDEATVPPTVSLFLIREARHPLPKDVVSGLTACFGSGA